MRDSLDLDRDYTLHDKCARHHKKATDHDHRLAHRICKEQTHVLRIHLIEEDREDNRETEQNETGEPSLRR